MLDEFIAKVSTELQQEGYLVELSPRIPGVQAWLYARSPHRVRLGVARVEDHFLFVDWDNSVFGRLDQLIEVYRRFSSFVNRGFRTPHVLRMQIPNLAVVAVSQKEFPDDAVRFARTTSLTPWYGGEVGQVILVEIENMQMISLDSLNTGRSPRFGAFALGHAAEIIWAVSLRVFKS
jgi:hypothetical protein